MFRYVISVEPSTSDRLPDRFVSILHTLDHVLLVPSLYFLGVSGTLHSLLKLLQAVLFLAADVQCLDHVCPFPRRPLQQFVSLRVTWWFATFQCATS